MCVCVSYWLLCRTAGQVGAVWAEDGRYNIFVVIPAVHGLHGDSADASNQGVVIHRCPCRRPSSPYTRQLEKTDVLNVHIQSAI